MAVLPTWLANRVRDPVYGNGFALVANAGISALLGFLFWMVAARRFNADALGIGAAIVSAATLAALIGKAGFDAAIIRYVPAADARRARRFLATTTLATIGLTTFVAIVVLAVATSGVPALASLLHPAYAAGFVVLAVGTAGAWILDAYYISEQRAPVVLLRNVAFNGVKLVVPLLLVYEWGGRAVPLAWGVGLLASLAVALALLPRHLAAHRVTAGQPERGAFGYSMRNYTLNLSEFLPGLVLPILVLHALGAEANARFYLAWTVATVAFLASKAIAQSAFAALVREGDPRVPVLKAFALSGLLLGPAALVIYLGAPFILGLFSPAYSAAAELLRLLALSVPALIVTNIYLSYLKARDDGWELTLLPLTSLAMMLAAMPIALRMGGIEGVGLVWLGVQAIIGGYAGVRLVVKLRRNVHATFRIGFRRHPHQG